MEYTTKFTKGLLGMPSRYVNKDEYAKDILIFINLCNPKENQNKLHWEVKHFSTNRKGNQQRLQE